ncbi:vacuolar-processing enzyme beta-isozyme, partial [Tanacetum coccineum]
GKEILDMPTVELEMSHLLATLARMEQQEHVQSLVLYVSSCHSAKFVILEHAHWHGGLDTFLLFHPS